MLKVSEQSGRLCEQDLTVGLSFLRELRQDLSSLQPGPFPSEILPVGSLTSTPTWL